jgi:hypothetical protein
VPTLGFKRGLEDDVVVAPYATVLALPYDPRAVVANVRRLEQLGGSGVYGLYDALDFTPPRLGANQRHAVVRSYMAHHQGMILTALDNYLNNDILVRRFHAASAIKTAEPLLFERPARQAPIERTGRRLRRGHQPAGDDGSPCRRGNRSAGHSRGTYSPTAITRSSSPTTVARGARGAISHSRAAARTSPSVMRGRSAMCATCTMWSLVVAGRRTSRRRPRGAVFHPHMVEAHAHQRYFRAHAPDGRSDATSRYGRPSPTTVDGGGSSAS